ncbi:bifunctional enoyl-CoA hydratase/phosphate acetyltransferase [Sphaerotilus montanus]|uniref:Phosphate acetyltransferase n=3 Tax=Sphaerotilus montanus TaxID=522889 RepID=A0A7Y9U5M2_9BURK|nr:bifunctional enoyl-CoA hydratase/phosphate acetyltransferase [Sphaerotilus montanus]NYG31811.1 phosphate acetyltransferase [Sphaerotilus montanus]NZD59223.1 bifunctional enoyl-CoA hydratase/phosphate acetyltransferase [Sphaerotilus montanus]
MNDTMITNRTYDEMPLGASASIVRTLTQDDILAFALVSGDVNPAHVDAEYANATRFHGTIAHGMWAGALISTLLGTHFPGPGTIYEAQMLRFHLPVRAGDTLTIQATVTARDDERHRLTLDCVVTNQAGAVVVSGEAMVRAPLQKISRPRAAMPTMHLFDPAARLTEWVDGWAADLAGQPPVPCGVVHPCDEASLAGAMAAARRGLIVPWLIGPEARIRAVAAGLGLDLTGVRIEAVEHSHAAAARAAELAAAGTVEMLIKGSLHTDELMHAVIATPALRTKRRISHVFRFDVPAYPKPLLITDAAINIAPTLEEKADIVSNAIDLARVLGVARPKVAILAAVETVSTKMASTLDAAALCKMADRGQITGGLLDGPLAFDNAISAEAARIKGIRSEVAGDADILLVPDLEAGNMLAKQLDYLAGAAGCGIVLGVRVPIALTSRADGEASRLASAALAARLALAWRTQRP